MQQRNIADDAAKLCGAPPYNTPMNLCYGDGYFDNDCRRHWGDVAWERACTLARHAVPAQGAASPWTHSYSGLALPQPGEALPGFNCQGAVTGRRSSREPPFKELPRDYADLLKHQDPNKRRRWLEGEWDPLTCEPVKDCDFGALELRVLAHCSESAEFTQAMWDALGRCPWDNWKPGRDVA